MVADFALLALVIAAIISLFYAPISSIFSCARVLTFSLFALVTVALTALFYAHICDDFSLSNVYLNSHSTKPLLYKIFGVWGNHEGSVLLWVWILYFYGLLLELFLNNQSLKAPTLSIHYLIGCGFLSFCIFVSNPFEKMPFAVSNGLGFNPLLQDIGLAIHPPILYFGYVGFSTVFAISLAALIMRSDGREWAIAAKPWVMLPWSCLTLGIGLGSWWAYRELGWGGFWFWDPVENVSLMPWLLATALLHLMMLVRKFNALRDIAILLALGTFSLSLIGTFLVRSGVLISVHSFASDPQRGIYILTLLALVICSTMMIFILRPQEKVKFLPLSSDIMILINNVLFVTAFIVVFVGTIYPIVLEYLTGDVISIGAPYYNTMFNGISICILITMIIGSEQKFVTRNRYSLIAAAVLLPFIVFHKFMVVSALLLSSLIIFSTIESYIRKFGCHTFKKRHAMSIAHLGVAVLVLGITCATEFQQEKEKYMRENDVINIGKFHITLTQLSLISQQNFHAVRGNFSIKNTSNKIVGSVAPENRIYLVEKTKSIESDVYHYLWLWDVYVVIGDFNEKNEIAVKVYYKPAINLIWLGVAMMVFGGLLSLYQRDVDRK